MINLILCHSIVLEVQIENINYMWIFRISNNFNLKILKNEEKQIKIKIKIIIFNNNLQ